MSGNLPSKLSSESRDQFSRRRFIRNSTTSFAGLALSALAHEMAAAEEQGPLDPKQPHFKARAKSVIYLSMNGGPSQVDTFDYKPELQKNDGKSANAVGGGTASRLARKGKLWGSPWQFSQHGESGLHISELFPNVAKHADDLCLLNGMHTDVSGHALATQMQFTGSFQFTRPSLGSWVLYGLGSEATDIPGFVSLRKREFGPAFLPPYYQPTELDVSVGVDNIRNPAMNSKQQRAQLDFLHQVNDAATSKNQALTEAVDSLRADYEMAFKMQTSLPASSTSRAKNLNCWRNTASTAPGPAVSAPNV